MSLFIRLTTRFRGICLTLPLVAAVDSFSLAAPKRADADVSHESGKIKTSELRETSGLAASRLNPDVLWLHNDGSSGQLFALSTTGKLVAALQCDVPIADLEDIAIGPGPEAGEDYIYLGDIGDNSARRREVRIIRFPEPKLVGERGQQLSVDDPVVLRLVYPDGPHDAESLMVDPLTGDLLIVTKERGGARIYSATQTMLGQPAAVTLTALGKANVEEVSAGAISPDGLQIILRREDRGWLWRRRPGEGVAEALAAKPEKVEVLGKRQGPNGEAVSFSPAGDRYYTVSEGKKQSIYRFDVPPPPDASSR